MNEDEQITEEDVKAAAAEFEKNIEELGSTPEESSPKEKKPTESTSEVVNTETVEEEPKVIPYERFKEVNQKVKELEEYRELYESNKQYVRKNPETGKLEVFVPEETKQLDEDSKRYDFDEEEQLAFDEVQQRRVDKTVERILYQREKQAKETQKYYGDVNSHWEDAKKEFPEVADTKSKLYQAAQQILKTKYVQNLGNGKIYVPPHAHYTCVLEAANKLRRESEGQKKIVLEEKKTQKTSAFVQAKVSKGPEGKKKVSDKELEGLSSAELRERLEEDFYELHPEERPAE